MQLSFQKYRLTRENFQRYRLTTRCWFWDTDRYIPRVFVWRTAATHWRRARNLSRIRCHPSLNCKMIRAIINTSSLIFRCSQCICTERRSFESVDRNFLWINWKIRADIFLAYPCWEKKTIYLDWCWEIYMNR